MKKSIFFAAIAALTLSLASCDKEENNTVDNGVINTELRVKSVTDLIGTEWTYTLSLTDMIGDDLSDCLEGIDLDLVFGLNFDTTYAHLTFPEDVIGLNVVDNGNGYTVEEIQQMDYTYTYDPSTQTGTLSGGNLDDIVLPFTYDYTNDIITVSMMIANGEDDDNPVPFDLIFSRVNAQ